MTKSNYPQGESVNDCPIPNRVECLIAMRKRTSKVAAKILQRCGKKVQIFFAAEVLLRRGTAHDTRRQKWNPRGKIESGAIIRRQKARRVEAR
jgi:hypothetical protein